MEKLRYRWKVFPKQSSLAIPEQTCMKGEKGSTLLCGESRVLETILYSKPIPEVRRCVELAVYVDLRLQLMQACYARDQFFKDKEALRVSSVTTIALGSVPALLRNDIVILTGRLKDI